MSEENWNAEKVEYYSNYDLDNVVTPVKVDRLIYLLEESGYPEHKIQFLRQGFQEGFDIGYSGPQNRQSVSENIPLTVGSPIELWNKVMEELKLG